MTDNSFDGSNGDFDSIEHLQKTLQFIFDCKFKVASLSDCPQYKGHFDKMIRYYYGEYGVVDDPTTLSFQGGEQYDPEVHGVWRPLSQEMIDRAVASFKSELN